jgi:von Willebrand factor type A domain
MEIALVVLVLALPGLAIRRGGPGMARLAALVAIVAIGFAVLNLTEETRTVIPRRVAVVPTVPLESADADALRRRFADPGVVRFENDGTRLGHRLGRARLRGREDPRLVSLWTGPVPGRDRDPRPARRIPADALSDVPLAPLDPADIVVRAVTVPRAGRPSAFEVAVPGRVAAVRGRLRVLDPGGVVVMETPFDGTETPRIAWQPVVSGRHEVHLTVRVGAVDYEGAGVVDVAPAPAVTIVGRRAAALAKALLVQGLQVHPVAELPTKLTGTLVLLDRLDAAAQERVRRFVEDDGGGLFLVGGADGGAVPGDGDTLAAVCPVRRPPLPKAPPKPGGMAGPGGDRETPGEDPQKAPRGAKLDENDPLKKPEKEPEKKPKKDPKKDGTAAKGDTTGARIKIEEREVKRRSIAMVLVIDRSGSMSERVRGEVSRMDLAKASARHTAEALDPQDQLGIVSFGVRQQARVVLPMTPVTKTRSIIAALSGLRATDNETRIAHGLQRALGLLAKVEAAVKYVVVITDGELADVRHPHTGIVADGFKKAGVSLCIVQVFAPGSHPAFDATSKTQILARRGSGDLVQQSSFEAVPRVISAEVEKLRGQLGRASRRSKDRAGQGAEKPRQGGEPEAPPKIPDPQPAVEPVAREYEVNFVEDSNLLRPRESDIFPSVAGVLQARSRDDARVLLSAGTEGYVLLAFANRGLGKVGVWSADFMGAWGERWAADPAFPGRLAQWIQHLEPAGTGARGRGVVDRPEPVQEVVVPWEASLLEDLAGTPLRPIETFVSPAPRVETEIRGRASRHAWYGLIFLVLLAAIEFLAMRRSGRRAI